MTCRSMTILILCLVPRLDLLFAHITTQVSSNSAICRLAVSTYPFALNAAMPMQQEGIIDVRAHGAVADGITDDTAALRNANSAAAALGGTLFFPPGTYRITSNISIVRRVSLWFANGAVIAGQGSPALTVYSSGNIIAGSTQQIVDPTTCTLAFDHWTSVSVCWFGADPSGSSDSLIAIRAANQASGCIWFPAGTYRVAGQIDLAGKVYWMWQGEGMENTRIVYNGPDAVDSVLDLGGAHIFTMLNMGIATDPNCHPETVVLMGRTFPNTSAGNHYFQNCTFDGYPTKATAYSISSEMNKYINCHFVLPKAAHAKHVYYTSIADDLRVDPNLLTSGGNTLAIQAYSCNFIDYNDVDNSRQLIYVNTVAGTQGLTFDKCYFADLNGLSDVTLYNYSGSSIGPGGPFTFTDCRWEGNARYALYLDSDGGPGGYIANVNILRCKFACASDSYDIYVADDTAIRQSRFLDNNHSSGARNFLRNAAFCHIRDCSATWELCGVPVASILELNNDSYAISIYPPDSEKRNGYLYFGGDGHREDIFRAALTPSNIETGYVIRGESCTLGAYTPGLAFGSSAPPRAAIAGVMDGFDYPQMGLAFFVHPSRDGSDPAVEAMRLRYSGEIQTRTLEPQIDDMYYLGRNDAASPLAWKGVVLKDTANGKYYRIEVTDGRLTATQLPSQ